MNPIPIWCLKLYKLSSRVWIQTIRRTIHDMDFTQFVSTLHTYDYDFLSGDG